VVPDPKNPAKADVILGGAARGFTNSQITIQVSSQVNKNTYTQMILAINLNCAPIFPSFPPGSPGSAANNRFKFPSTSFHDVTCDGNPVTPPIIIGAFSVGFPFDLATYRVLHRLEFFFIFLK
jgi:hypothetical protein